MQCMGWTNGRVAIVRILLVASIVVTS